MKNTKKTHALGDDDLVFDDSIDFVYHTKVKSLEELKVPYDRAMGFIAFVSEKYPVLIDEGLLNIRMDITGIRLKGADDDDTLIFQDISKAKKRRYQHCVIRRNLSGISAEAKNACG